MAIAARVVSDAAVAAILAALDMAAERGRAALLDRRHDLELSQAHMSGIGPAPVGPMAMKDVCDLQLRIAASPRSMVRAGRVGWLRLRSSNLHPGGKAPYRRALV